jgi:hypothetical protein
MSGKLLGVTSLLLTPHLILALGIGLEGPPGMHVQAGQTSRPHNPCVNPPTAVACPRSLFRLSGYPRRLITKLTSRDEILRARLLLARAI